MTLVEGQRYPKTRGGFVIRGIIVQAASQKSLYAGVVQPFTVLVSANSCPCAPYRSSSVNLLDFFAGNFARNSAGILQDYSRPTKAQKSGNILEHSLQENRCLKKTIRGNFVPQTRHPSKFPSSRRQQSAKDSPSCHERHFENCS